MSRHTIGRTWRRHAAPCRQCGTPTTQEDALCSFTCWAAAHPSQAAAEAQAPAPSAYSERACDGCHERFRLQEQALCIRDGTHRGVYHPATCDPREAESA